jgi:hypothetical protein
MAKVGNAVIGCFAGGLSLATLKRRERFIRIGYFMDESGAQSGNASKEHLQNKTTQLNWFQAQRSTHMIDAKAFEVELQQARLARLEAEAANSDVEEMIWEVQHAPTNAGCFAYFFAGLDQDVAAAN